MLNVSMKSSIRVNFFTNHASSIKNSLHSQLILGQPQMRHKMKKNLEDVIHNLNAFRRPSVLIESTACPHPSGNSS